MKFLSAIAAVMALGIPSGTLAARPDCTEQLAPPDRDQGGRPILVLLGADPWADVIGSDSPSLALYDDGLLIFRSRAGYRSTRLNPREVAAFKAGIGFGALTCAVGDYSLTDITDQPMTYLFMGRGGDLSRVSVYGRIDSAAGKRTVPAAVGAAYDALKGFDRPDARPWLPDRIEVMLWPYEYAPDASIIWPAKWPTTSSRGAIRRGDSFSVFVPSKDYGDLVAFLKGRKAKGAVEVDGKKWAVSIRFPFPHEDKWMR